MPQTRSAVRSAIRSSLADATHGFNAKLAAVASTYGITAFTISWNAADSATMIQSQFDPEGRAASRLPVTGASATIYTTESRQDRRAMSGAFDGRVRAHVDFFIRFADGENTNDDLTESYGDAVEDAVIRVLTDPASAMISTYFNGTNGVYYTGGFGCLRPPIEQTADGFAMLLPFQFLYEVRV
jgi:hypothetical protein